MKKMVMKKKLKLMEEPTAYRYLTGKGIFPFLI
jgi:hypothetical protein